MEFYYDTFSIRGLILFVPLLVSFIPHCQTADCPALCRCPTNLTADCSWSSLTAPPRTGDDLVKLDLSHNALGPIINSSFPRMASLVELDLSYNGLTRLLGCTLQGMLGLKRLSLRGNRLRGLPDSLFTDANGLTHLDVSYNILMVMPDHTFRNLMWLQALDMSHNRMEQLQFGLGLQVPRHLKTVDLSYNNFETITVDSFQMASGWEPGYKRTLIVANCRLSSIQPLALSKIPGLNDLDLSGNPELPLDNLTSVVKELETKGLEKLSLCSLNLTTLVPFFSQVTQLSLKFLNVSDNHIDIIPENTFSTISSLRVLDLSRNKLTSLSEGFSDLRNLKELNLSQNQMTSFNGDAVSNINNLKVLDVSRNLLSDPQQVTFAPLTKLTSLDVNNNLMTSVVVPETTPELKRFDYHSNAITHFAGFDSVAKLEYFDLSDNDLEKISEFLFKEARFLKVVNFSKNSVTELDHRAFLPQSSLVIDLSHNFLTTVQFSNWVATQELYLNHNEIAELDIQTFHLMNGLKVLDLSENKISHLNEDLFDFTVGLKHLNLSHNSIGQTYFFQLFRNLVNLETLDLGNNNISHLNESMLLPLPNIQRFSLSQNNLDVVKPRVFRDLAHIKEIDLSGNPFVCSCDNLGFQDWLSRTKIPIVGLYSTNSSSYVCKAPSYWAGTNIKEWSPDQFECDKTMLYMIIFGSVGLTIIVAGVVSTAAYRLYKCHKRRKEEREKARLKKRYYGDDEIDGRPKGGKLDLSRMTSEEIAEEINNAIERRERRSMRKAEEINKKNSNGHVPSAPNGNKKKDVEKNGHENHAEKSDRKKDKQKNSTEAKQYDRIMQHNEEVRRPNGKRDRDGERHLVKEEDMRGRGLKVHRPSPPPDGMRLPPPSQRWKQAGRGYSYLEPEPDYGYQTDPAPRRGGPRQNRWDNVAVWDRDSRGWVMQGQGQRRSRSQGHRREGGQDRYLTMPIREQDYQGRERGRSNRRGEQKMYLDRNTNEVRFGIDDLRRYPDDGRKPPRHSRWDAHYQQQQLRSRSFHHLPQDYSGDRDHDRPGQYSNDRREREYRSDDDRRPLIGPRAASQPYLVGGNTSDWL